MTHQDPATDAAVSAPPQPRKSRLRGFVSLVLLASFALLFYLAALIVTLPATALHRVAVVPAQITDLYGSLWKGRAVLSGGYSLDWEVRGQPLLLARGVVDWTLQGRDTQLTGVARATPWALEAETVVGRAGPGLMALIPGLALKNCTSRAVVDLQSLSWREGRATAAGVVSVEAGNCEDLLGRAASVPQMTLDLTTQGNDARGLLRDRDSVLAELTVTGDRRVIARVEPEGAVLVPGMPTGGPIIIEYPF